MLSTSATNSRSRGLGLPPSSLGQQRVGILLMLAPQLGTRLFSVQRPHSKFRSRRRSFPVFAASESDASRSHPVNGTPNEATLLSPLTPKTESKTEDSSRRGTHDASMTVIETEMDEDSQTVDAPSNPAVLMEDRSSDEMTSAMDVLDQLSSRRDGLLQHMELVDMASELRDCMMKGNFVTNEIIQHPEWDRIVASFLAVKEQFLLQQLARLLTVVSFLDGHPIALREALFEQLKTKGNELQIAKQQTWRSLLKSAYHLNRVIDPSLVRLLHDRVMNDIGVLPAPDLILALRMLYNIKPIPSPGLTSMIIESAIKEIESFEGEDLIVLCEAMSLILPPPSPEVQGIVIDRCLNLRQGMSVKLLMRLLSWMKMLGYPTSQSQQQKLDADILEMVDVIPASALNHISVSYLLLEGSKNTEVMLALCEAYISHRVSHSVFASSLFNQFLRKHKILGRERAIELVNAAEHCLNEASITDLVSLFSDTAALKLVHPILGKLVPRLLSTTELDIVDASRFICSCLRLQAELKLHPGKLAPFINNCILNRSLEKLDTKRLVMLADVLMKLGFKQKKVALHIADAAEKRLNALSLKWLIVVTRAVATIGPADVARGLIQEIQQRLDANLSGVQPDEVSLLLRMISAVGPSTDDALIDQVFKLIERDRVYLDQIDFMQAFRSASKHRIFNRLQLKHLIEIIVETSEDIDPVSISWILSGIACYDYDLSEADFRKMSKNFVDQMEDTDMFALKRFVSATHKLSFLDEDMMKKVAKRLRRIGPERSVSVVGKTSWTLATSGYRDEALTSWLQNYTSGLSLLRASHATVVDLTISLCKFGARPVGFAEEIEKRTIGQIHLLTPYKMGWMLRGMIVLDHIPSRLWIDEAIQFFEHRIYEFPSQMLCNTLALLVKLDYRPSKKIIADCMAVTVDGGYGHNLLHIANFLEACAQSGYNPVPLLSEIEDAVIKHADRQTIVVAASLIWATSACGWRNREMFHALAWACYDKLEEMAADVFAKCMWGLSHAGFSDAKFYLKAARIASNLCKSMDGTDIQRALWSFARADKPAPDFIRQALERLPAFMHHYQSHELASLSWALARITDDTTAIARSLEAEVQNRLDSFNFRALATVLYAFANMSYIPDASEEITRRLANAEMTGETSAVTLLHALYACQTFNCNPPQNLLSLLEQRLMNETPVAWKAGGAISTDTALDTKHLIHCLWCLYSLKLQESDAAMLIAERVCELDVLEHVREEGSQELMECLLLCRFGGYENPLTEIQNHYLEDMMHHWRSIIDARAMESASRMKKNIAECLDTMDVPYNTNVITDDKSLLLDYLVSSEDGNIEIVLDVNEEGSFKNSAKLNGKAQFSAFLKESAGLKVIPLTKNSWDAGIEEHGNGSLFLHALLVSKGLTVEKPKRSKSNTIEDISELNKDPGQWVDNFSDDFMS